MTTTERTVPWWVRHHHEFSQQTTTKESAVPTTVTRDQAEAALQAVKDYFAKWTADLILDGENFGPTIDTQPVLLQGLDGVYQIIWEDGPDDWAMTRIHGEDTEEDRALRAEAGLPNYRTTPRKALVLPKGVHAEPYMSFVLSLYTEG
jgi:hypothetical protein